MTFDYHKLVNINTPQEERRKWDIGDIFSNEAQCLECKDIIRSKNRHDFVTCKCGELSVDGGSWYAKRSYNASVKYKDMIVYFNDTK